MTIRKDFIGYRYDDAEPAFFPAGMFYWHRITARLIGKAGLDAAMTAAGYTAPAGEIGAPSAAYIATHMGAPISPAAPPPAAVLAAITAAVAGTGTASATITLGGGPADKAYTIALTANAGAVIAGIASVAVAKSDTAAQVATKVAAALNGKKDAGSTKTLAAVAAAAKVTVTEAGGGNIATLTAVVS
jgi:hypothetical protein